MGGGTPDGIIRKIKMNKKRLILSIGYILMVLVIYQNLSLSYTLQDIDLSPNNATTTDNLICTWTLSGSAMVNVSWYNNSVLHATIEDASNPQILSYTQTKRGQTWNCTVRAGNATNVTVLSDTVTIKNALPSAPNASNFTLIEDQVFNTTLNSTDPDGDPITYFYESSTITLDTFTSNTGYLNWLPEQSDVGLHNISFYAKDNQELTLVGIQVIWNVTYVNDMPYFNPSLSKQTINEGEPLTYLVTGADEENTTGPLNFTINSTFNPEQLNFTASNGYQITIHFINSRNSNYSDRGNHTVTVKLCDPDNSTLCVSENFELEVIPVNQPPVLELIGNYSGNQTENFTVYVNATDLDTQDILTFSISGLDCPVLDPWSITTLNNSYNATGIINITPLNNSHVACRYVRVTVSDAYSSDYQDVFFNITNVNDPPIINKESYYSENSHNNYNISALIGYVGMEFRYRVNGSDIDNLTYEGENLTFESNATSCVDCPNFVINSTTGLISFTPNSSYIGNFSYEVNLSDDQGLYDTEILRMTIYNNTAPYFNETLTNYTAFEDQQFLLKINASDNDGNFWRFTDNSTLFIIDPDTGQIDFTPACSDIGNYSINITITDTAGAYNSSVFTLFVNNTPDAPMLPFVYPSSAMQSRLFYLDIGYSTTDEDISCKPYNDSLFFNSTFIEGDELFNISSDGLINFTPELGQNGTYRINISVMDSFGLNDSLILNLTVYNNSLAPVMYNLTAANSSNLSQWRPLIDFPNNMTIINITENTTIIFNHTTIDPESDPLVYFWLLDDVEISRNHTLSYYFDFNSSGDYALDLYVNDNVSDILANNISFRWLITVNQVNRPPVLVNALPNQTYGLTIMGITRRVDYLTGPDPDYPRFYDPDNDTLNYSSTSTSYVTIVFEGNDAIFTPISTGLEYVVITASDGEYSAESNNVTINVSYTEQEQPIPQTRTKTKTKTVLQKIIEEKEKEKPIYLDIIVPEPITLYRNNTIRAPIILVNNANDTLGGIKLSAETNISTVDVMFSTDYFGTLVPGQQVTTDMIITSYKTFNHYEIVIWANITEPNFRDNAVVYVNSIEKTKGNQSVASTKITFANDLLASNPECLELNEFLNRAMDRMEAGDYESAAKIVDSVIQGCKYLVSQTQLRKEKPTGAVIFSELKEYANMNTLLIAVIVLIVTIMLVTILKKKKKTKKK
ncbi:hypothetical protein JW930_02480 [Candidatus Woesearchaeota archaeon]|nr:hypothetical protein [Candidatus Woesearchaeota archaeon]